MSIELHVIIIIALFQVISRILYWIFIIYKYSHSEWPLLLCRIISEWQIVKVQNPGDEYFAS